MMPIAMSSFIIADCQLPIANCLIKLLWCKTRLKSSLTEKIGNRQLAIGNPLYCSTGYPALTHAPVPPDTLRRFENPCFCNKLAAALDRYPPAQIMAVGLFF